jgi:hypothetical protein
MIKMITLLKRKAGMTLREFIDYYEASHRVIGEKYLRGHASRYVRRYLHPIADPASGNIKDAEYDVLMEIWFPDQAAFEAAMEAVTQPEAAREIAEDEARLFDPERRCTFTVEEFESDM